MLHFSWEVVEPLCVCNGLSWPSSGLFDASCCLRTRSAPLGAEGSMIHASDKVRPRDIGKYLALIAIVLVSCFLAGKLGQATIGIRSGNIGPVWPAFGVALAAVLLGGYRVWPGIFLGSFLVDLLSPVPVVASLGQASGSTLAAIGGAFALRRMASFESSFSRFWDALGM